MATDDDPAEGFLQPVMLMAAKFGVPVCPHAGGVGLCEYVQHLAIVDNMEPDAGCCRKE